MNKDPLGIYLSHGDLGLFDLGSAISELDSTLDSISHLGSPSWAFIYDPLSPLVSSPMPLSVVSPPKRELKPLPNSLKYVFLGPKEALAVIISPLSSCDQERVDSCLIWT